MTGVKKAFNLTGVVLHTGLGRAPLADEVVAAMVAASRAAEVEVDVPTGGRGERQDAVRGRCERLFGLPGCAFNNNAAATLLTLAATAAGREVVVGVSRLVAIGGSFAMPAVMRQSGCTLREVGSVNRTTVSDYAEAIGENTGALFSAHRSNFRLEGRFTEPSLAELVELAHSRGLPFVYDQGSGLVREVPWAPGADDVTSALRAGADLVCFSGDKVFGGPQAGIVVGRADLIEGCARHPLARAARLDKVTLAGLAATLDIYLEGREAELPAHRLLSATGDELLKRAEALLPEIERIGDGRWGVRVEETVGRAGSGALPLVDFPSAALALTSNVAGCRELAGELRARGIFGRVEGERLLLDLRALLPEEEEGFQAAVSAAASEF
ncbi:MAG: L-seryl-tRNA(Sec) selenium transferase [Candidatus Coatesbacteria bacterium RBG_13_66_14]|uniref:L-seryl-tRNA(Sec) selenium transferase n=1 Tax=Candidatus Coatesbacteria bacterium RBG_13_66_14 TaxID=1817816 RepID=A0A1F5FIY7_9BACT|nr:MAG: L-seryl-tRNA(Sec) selenium transferase [Candidatus Coatesbacteria bacterium RBG_13_66_14]